MKTRVTWVKGSQEGGKSNGERRNVKVGEEEEKKGEEEGRTGGETLGEIVARPVISLMASRFVLEP